MSFNTLQILDLNRYLHVTKEQKYFSHEGRLYEKDWSKQIYFNNKLEWLLEFDASFLPSH